MSARQLLRLAVVLGALLLLWGALALAHRRSSESSSGPRLLGVDTAAVDSVIVRSATDTVNLVRSGPNWQVNGFRAAPDEVSGLLRALADTAESELVAESRTSHVRLGVDSASGRRVRVIRKGKALLDLLVGSGTGGLEGGYLRRIDDPKVYRVRGSFAELAARKADDWRDKTIISVPPDSIGSIAIRRDLKEYELRRDGKRWRFGSGGGEKADSARAANLVRDLAQIRAAGFAADSQMASLRFTRPDGRLVLKTPAGGSLAALVFDSTTSGIWVRHDSSGRGTIWRIESWDWDRIMPAKKSLQ